MLPRPTHRRIRYPALRSVQAAGGPLDAGAATARVAAGRRLGSALSSLHSSLSGRVSSSASRGQASGFRRALSPALPFVMLPLQLALAPANRDEDGRGGGVAKMPAAVREKALLCVAAAIRGSGSSFVEVRSCALDENRAAFWLRVNLRGFAVVCERRRTALLWIF